MPKTINRASKQARKEALHANKNKLLTVTARDLIIRSYNYKHLAHNKRQQHTLRQSISQTSTRIFLKSYRDDAWQNGQEMYKQRLWKDL